MKDSVDQFRDIMLPQLDLRVEAHNLQRFRRDFEGESQIAFPEPLVELTSREVLVEKFVEGEPMLNFVLREDENHSKKDREELARIGLETVMKMIFLHDFIHADLVSKIACSLFVDMSQVFTTLAINSHHACLLAHVLPSQ
jgi:aarF domain-containing kinase